MKFHNDCYTGHEVTHLPVAPLDIHQFLTLLKADYGATVLRLARSHVPLRQNKSCTQPITVKPTCQYISIWHLEPPSTAEEELLY